MPRQTASPADECANQAATSVIEFIEAKIGCKLDRYWYSDLADEIGTQIDRPIDEALDEAYDEGVSDGEDSVTEGGA